MPSATTPMPQAVRERDDRLDDRAVGGAVEPRHERAVDLDRVERQVLEVRQRRVAGPEVVEHEADPQVAQPPQGPDARPRTGPSRRDSVISSSRARRVEAGLGEDLGDLVDEVRLGELAGRQVDRHHERRPARVAASRQTAAWRQAVSRTQRPSGTIRPVSSARRDERERRDEARASGCCQRTSASKPDDPVGRAGRRSAGSGRAARRARARGAGRSRGRSARASASLIDGSNRAWRLVGSPFARTIAISASRRSSSGVTRPGSPRAIPIEALMNHSRPPIANGARSSAAMRSAMRSRLVGVRDRVEDDPELVAAEAGDGVARPQAARPAAGRPRPAAGRRRRGRRSR